MSNLKYITLNQLMASVEQDLNSFADQGMIDRGKVIKVVRRVNEDIGLKINRENQAMVEIQNYKGELPADFMALQAAFACQLYHHNFGTPSFGTITEEHNVPVKTLCNDVTDCDISTAKKNATCLNECNGCYWVTQKFENKTIKYSELVPLKLTKGAQKFCTENCLNFRFNNAGYDIDIQNDEIITGFREGKIYISYLSDMVNEDGDLLLLDHPLTYEYYEYAVKKHLLENWMLNNDADVAQKLGYIKNELRQAQIRAINFVTTPEYSEIYKTYNNSRKMFYNKYVKMFE